MRAARRRPWALVVVACLLAACDPEPRRPVAAPPRQAMLILLDAARADRFSSWGYPRDTTPQLDALARRGLLFTRFFSQASYTRASLSSLFYSRYFPLPVMPASPRVPLLSPDELFRTLDAEAISLPRVLAAAGIATAGVSAHSWITADSELAIQFDEFHDLSAALSYPPRQHHPRAEQVVDWVIDWLDGNAGRDFFLYLHLMDTHFPHVPGEDTRRFHDGGPDTPARFDGMGRPKDTSTALSGGDRAHLDALYDGSLRYTDRQVGRLLDHLAAAGRLDTMVVMVTADHGEELLEHPERFGHGGPWRDALGHVPFIVHAPGRVPAARSDAFGEMVDLAPTLLGLLGVALPADKRVDGIDLVQVVRGQRAAKRHVVMPQGIRSARWKLLFPGASPLEREHVPRELYDLESDPGETRDVSAAHPAEIAALLAAFRDTLREPHARWQAAVGTDPPASGFAIAVADVRLTPAVPVLGGRPGVRELARAAGGGWALSRHPVGHALVAGGGAPPLGLELRVPDGEYRLRLAMRGGCVLDVAGGPHDAVLQSAAGAARGSLHDVEFVDVGVVRITGQRFRATLRPLPESPPLLVRTVGFEPLGAAASDPAAAREREERLRGLGYLE